MSSATLINQIKAARRCSTPLIGITTPDPAATVQALCQVITETHHAEIKEVIQINWDSVRGFTSLNKHSVENTAELKGDPDYSISNPTEAFKRAPLLKPCGMLFIHLANRWLDIPDVVQGICNLRDQYKGDRRTLILLGPALTLPPELSGDVIVFDEPLPDEAAIDQIVTSLHAESSLSIDKATREKAVAALMGLPAFQTEQVTAMCLSTAGLDIKSLWNRKRRQIELTPGLRVHRDAVKFDGIGGVPIIKDYLKRILHGQARPNAVVFVDEIEKMMAGSSGGSGGDTSGVSQDQLGSLLSYMQDQGAAGMIFIGPPGSAKSMVAKAAGNEVGIPTIQLDLGAMKGSLVGQSEQQLRSALKVITAVSNGQSLWIATCNSIGELPPELRRRFTLGTFFFDLPSRDERASIWGIHLAAYRLAGSSRFHGSHDLPEDEGWTGAEIKQCCDIAWRLEITLKEAAKFIVPVSKAASDVIARLRISATGKFLSASLPGVYRQQAEEAASSPAVTKRRPVAVS